MMHEGQSYRAPTHPDAAGVILVRPALRDAGLLQLIENLVIATGVFRWACEGFARGSLEFGGLRWAPLVNLKKSRGYTLGLHYYRVKWVLRSYSDHDSAQSKGSGNFCDNYHFGPHFNN